MKILTLLCALAFSSAVFAAEFSCPAVQPLIKNGKAGSWLTYRDTTRQRVVGAPANFESAVVRDGNLSSVGTLIPDNDEQEGKYWEWSLFWDQDTSYKHFAACAYKGSDVVLLRELPRNLKHCEVARGHSKQAQVVSCH